MTSSCCDITYTHIRRCWSSVTKWHVCIILSGPVGCTGTARLLLSTGRAKAGGQLHCHTVAVGGPHRLVLLDTLWVAPAGKHPLGMHQHNNPYSGSAPSLVIMLCLAYALTHKLQCICHMLEQLLSLPW